MRKKNEITEYVAAALIFVCAVAVSLGIFLVCTQNSIERNSQKVIKTNVSRQSEHIKAILDIHYGYLRGIAKEIGKSRLLSSYIMTSYFIAMNRSTGKSAEENYILFRDGLCASKLFHKVIGDVEQYLDPKKMPGRLQWSADSHKRKYENDWVVDILPGTETYDLGYDYHVCGACKLCQDEGCPELAAYICRMDYVLAEIMHMKLVRTGTIAEGAPYCDFRYSRLSDAEHRKES